MSAYIRGPVCGIDNCPSQLWRVIAGRRTCQYGHVMEGDVEFNDEDVTANTGIITRRLNLTTNATGSFLANSNNSQLKNSQITSKDRKVYGEPARKLFLRSFQYILRVQTKWLISHASYPPHFEHVVKLIWMEYLMRIGQSRATSNADIFSGEDTEVDGYYTNEDSNQPDDTGRGRKVSKNNRRDKLELSLTTTIAILYISATHLGLPIFTSDFIAYICTTKFPFLKANTMLPKIWRIKLPNYYLGLLDGKKIPGSGQIIRKIIFTCDKINVESNFPSKINTEGLVLKLILKSNLPPEYFLSTMHLIKTVDDGTQQSLFGSDATTYVTFYKFPEIRVISYFILTVRWTLMCDISDDKNFRYPNAWMRTLLSESGSHEEDRCEIENQITQLFYSNTKNGTNNNSNDLFNWNGTKTTDFLDWVENIYLSSNERYRDGVDEDELTIDQRIAKRKLEKMIPLHSSNFRPLGDTTPRRDTFLDQLQDTFIRLNNILGEQHSENPGDREVPERSKCIALLEDKMVSEISSSFGLSEEILRTSILRLEKHCISILRK